MHISSREKMKRLPIVRSKTQKGCCLNSTQEGGSTRIPISSQCYMVVIPLARYGFALRSVRFLLWSQGARFAHLHQIEHTAFESQDEFSKTETAVLFVDFARGIINLDDLLAP